MEVSATIKAGSAIDKAWRHRHRIGGDVSGARFRLLQGVYASEHVPVDSISLLSINPSVQLAFTTEPVGFAKVYLPDPAFDTSSVTQPIAPEPSAGESAVSDVYMDIESMLGTPLTGGDPDTRKSRGRPRKNV